MHTHTDTHVWREGKRSQRHGQWSDKSCRHTHVEGREETDHSDTGNGVTNRAHTHRHTHVEGREETDHSDTGKGVTNRAHTHRHVWREGKRQITVIRAKE